MCPTRQFDWRLLNNEGLELVLVQVKVRHLMLEELRQTASVRIQKLFRFSGALARGMKLGCFRLCMWQLVPPHIILIMLDIEEFFVFRNEEW